VNEEESGEAATLMLRSVNCQKTRPEVFGLVLGIGRFLNYDLACNATYRNKFISDISRLK
jgi:hypothetical protein